MSLLLGKGVMSYTFVFCEASSCHFFVKLSLAFRLWNLWFARRLFSRRRGWRCVLDGKERRCKTATKLGSHADPVYEKNGGGDAETWFAAYMVIGMEDRLTQRAV